MSDQPMKGPRDGLTVFIEALKGADRVVVETRNALGEMDAHYIHAPEILAAWNTRAAPKVKPLVFEEAEIGVWKSGRSLGGEYAIWNTHRGRLQIFRVNRGNIVVFGESGREDFYTLKEAEFAANRDYERHIISALTPETET